MEGSRMAESRGSSKALPRTTSPLVTLLQKNRETKKEQTSKPLKYTFNFTLNKPESLSNKTTTATSPSTTTTTKSTTITTTTSSTTTSPSTTLTTPYKHTQKYDSNNSSNTRYTPMDKIRENIVIKQGVKSDSRCTTPPDARYSHSRFENRPSSIEFYEPGSSSLSKPGGPDDDMMLKMPPINKPGDLCRYIVSPPGKKYKVKKSHPLDYSITPPLRPPTPHNVYMSVQKGGEVPIEGLYCPPFFKPDLRISTLKNDRYKELLNKNENPHPCKPFTTPCLPVPTLSLNSQKHSGSSRGRPQPIDDYVSLCELLATSHLSCRDRRNRDEINKARKLQMELYIKTVKMKKRIEEEKQNQQRRHCDYSCSKSPVSLDRYDLEDDVFSTTTTAATTTLSPHSPHSPQPAYKARALYPFTAKDSKELSLQKGDVVYVWGVVDENWMKGEHHGSFGIFPSSYVQIFQSFDAPLSPSFSHLYCLLYTFQAQASTEISLKKGDIVRVLERVNADWVKVELVKPRSIRERSPEGRLYSSPHHFKRSSSSSPLGLKPCGSANNSIINSRNRFNNHETTTSPNDEEFKKVGLAPSSYIIPLERNLDTINLFGHHSPREKNQDLLDANKPSHPPWKDIVAGVSGKELFFNGDYRRNSWKSDAGKSKSVDRKVGLFEQLYSPKNNRKHIGRNNITDSNKEHNATLNTKNKTQKYNQIHNETPMNTDTNTNHNDIQNDYLIDESYLHDLDALNASIDPLFYLNLSKLRNLSPFPSYPLPSSSLSLSPLPPSLTPN